MDCVVAAHTVIARVVPPIRRARICPADLVVGDHFEAGARPSAGAVGVVQSRDSDMHRRRPVLVRVVGGIAIINSLHSVETEILALLVKRMARRTGYLLPAAR